MTPFSVLGDSFHLFALLALIGRMWKTKSCSGLSARTQVGYFLVFLSRYLDLFVDFTQSYYLTIGKSVFLISSLLTVILMLGPYRSTYDRKNDVFYVEILIAACLVLAMLVNHSFTFVEIAWTFSIYLEAVVIIPQLYMISRTGKAETITYLYIIPLGLYKFLYIANWVFRYWAQGFYDYIAIAAGCVQTLLYFVFFYLYCTMDGFERLTNISKSDI